MIRGFVHFDSGIPKKASKEWGFYSLKQEIQ